MKEGRNKRSEDDGTLVGGSHGGSGGGHSHSGGYGQSQGGGYGSQQTYSSSGRGNSGTIHFSSISGITSSSGRLSHKFCKASFCSAASWRAVTAKSYSPATGGSLAHVHVMMVKERGSPMHDLPVLIASLLRRIRSSLALRIEMLMYGH